MAKKYWWEDENSTQADQQPQDQTKKTYWWEDESVASTVSEDIVNKVNDWIGRNNAYISDYQKRYAGRKGNYEDAYVSDSAEWWKKVKEQGLSLNQDAQSIINYMTQYEDYLDKKWVNEIKSTLNSSRSQYSKMFLGAQEDHDYWSQFEEEDYAFLQDHSTLENRQQWYEEQSSKLEKLKADKKNAAWFQAPGDYDVDSREYAASREENQARLKALDDEIAAIEAELRLYERGGYNDKGMYYGSKVVDDYKEVTKRANYITDSAYRSYDNPTKEDLDYYDAATDSEYFQFDTDAAGNKIAKDQFGNDLILVPNTEGLFKGGKRYASPLEQDDKYKIQDPLGMYLSASEEERAQYAVGEAGMDGTYRSVMVDGFYGNWEELTEGELGIYYALLKNNKEDAVKYLKDMETELNRRATEASAEKWSEGYAEANFLEKIALNVATVPAQLVGGIAGTIDNAANILTGNDINPYSAAHSGSNFSNTIRGETAKELDETGFNIPVIDFTLGDIYQSGMSILDSYVSIGIGGKLGGALLATNAASSEATRLYEQGASIGQIAVGSAAAGAAEMIFESLSIDNLINMKDAKTVGQLVKNALIQGGIEASEEGFTEIANILTNAIVMGSESDWAKLVEENGGNKWKAFLSEVQSVAQASFAGFLSGTGSATIPSAMSYGATQMQYADTGKTITNAGGVDALMSLANEVAGVSAGKTQKQINKQTGAVGKNATNRNVGRLYDTVNTTITEQNKADIATEIKNSGMSSKQANDIADALVALTDGRKLTSEQEQILKDAKNNSSVSKAIENIIGNEKSGFSERYTQMANFDNAIKIGTMVKEHTEKAFTPEGKFDVDVEGKTITKDTGEVIDIKGVASVKKGELLLDIGDGKTINAKNVAYSNKNDALIYEAIANLGDNINAEAANQLIAQYKGGDAMVFSKGMAQAYTYGFYGIDSSEMTGKHSLATELTEEQRNFAYVLGKQYRPVKDAEDKKNARATNAPSEKGVYYRGKDGNATDISTYLKESGIKLNDVQKTGIEMMRKMSEMLGVRFNVFESWVENGKRYYLNEDGVKTEGNPNGFYDTTTGEIYIDLNAGVENRGGEIVYPGTIVFTVAHELTHFMRQWSPEHFTKIADIVFKHGGMKGNVSELIALKQAKAKAKGKPISYDTAMEEVVADGMETILKDGKVVEFMAEVKQKDHAAWEKIKGWFKNLAKFLRKMVVAYRSHSAQTVEGQKVADFAENLLRQIEQIWAEGALAAGENYQVAIGNVQISNQITMGEDVIDSSNTGISNDAKTGVKMQERTEFEAQPKQVFSVSTTNGEADSSMLGTNKSVKELRDARFKENGFSKEEVDKINGFIKEMADNMAKYRLKYKFIGLQNIHDAKIILNPMTGKIVLSAMVNNSDYSVNFDFTKICKKRVALQEVLETLAREKGKVTDGKVTEVNLSPANIKRINDILASYGVETACLCCFVESKRYNIQNHYQEKVVDVWNALVDEVAPDAEYFNFADSDVDTSKIPDSEFAELEMQMREWAGKTGKSKNVEQKMREFLADSPAARKKLRFSDLVTANGRTNLHKLYPEIESLILSKLGQSAPKSVEAFTPYNGEIDLLEAKSNGDIVKYLYSIAGVRSQSFSDFMIAHVFDVLQKTASMSARKMPAHVYTKEIARAMLFGMTGEKHNMSVLHNVDPNVDSWSAGLSKDGEYNFSDYEAYKKGYSEFVQSIGWKDAVALQNTEGYSKDCGIIGVGFSYNHMLKLHNDPEVRQVIGYHTSSMPVEVKPLTHLDKAADYTSVQNTKSFVGFAKPNYAIPDGVPSYATPPQDVTYKGNKTTKVADTFDIVGTFNKLSKGKTGKARTAAAKETLRQLLEYANDHGYVITTAAGETGHGEFQLYEDVQKTENPYLTADHYIEYCIERGMLPMFFEFSMNPNYYKDIFDFNVFDRKSYNPKTGLHEDSADRKAYAPQTAVHMLNEDGSLAFPDNFFDIVDKQMNSYNSYMQDVDSKMPSIMDEVRAVTNSTTKLSDRDTRKVLYQDRISELTEEDVYRLIENSNHGEYALDTFIPVRRDTPPLLVELSKKEGLPPVKNLPIIMNVEHIQQCMDEEVAVNDGKRGHALTSGNIIEIIKGLDDPRYVFFQKDNKRYCEVVEYDVGNRGEKALAIVTYTGNKNQDLMNGFPGREYNILVTAYPPDAKYWREYQKSPNNVLIYDKTKDAPQGSYGSHVPSLLSGSPFATKVTQPATEVNSKVDRDSLTPDQQKHFDYNQKQKTVGSALKTLKGSAIKRSTKFGVGKEIGGEIYFHKDYAEDILPDEVLSQALQLLEEEHPGFEYNCLKYNPKTGVVAFQESPDFDSAREPVVGDYVSVNTDTGVVKTGHSNYIWHHKWNWVKNDYSGFDVAESWNWSKQWLSTLTEVSDGNGIERWNNQLDKFGLPHDGALFSDREQEYDSKDTSVKILPATFTKFGLKSTDRVLDWGGGQYDIAKKAVELGYPGIKFEVVDAFNRTKSHNDRILAEYAENPATVLTINNVLNVIKETDIIEDVIRESKEYLAEDGVCYIKIYEGNETDGKTGNGKVTSSGWQNNQPAKWYMPFAEKYYKYVEPVGDILVASDKPINKKELPKADKATAKVMRDKVAEIRKEEPSMRESLYSDRDTVYMDAIDRGDIVKAQKLVDESAKEAGYTVKAFHGTGEDFNIFSEEKVGGRNVWGKGFYFSASKGLAADYAYNRERKGGKYRIISASLKMENPYINRESSLGSAQEILDKWFPDMWKGTRELGLGYIQGKLNNDPHDLLQFIAERNKIEIRDVLDYYGYDSIKSFDELVVFSPTQIKSNEPVVWDDKGKVIPLSERFNKSNDDIRYSDRNEDSVSNRSLLANAFEGLAQNDIEKTKIQEYKSKIDLINAEEKKLRELNAQIKELSFAEGPRDTKKIKGLRFDAAQAANRINTYDKQLLRLEASKPLQDVLAREKHRAYKKAEERGKEALADYKAKVEAKQTETAEKWRESRKAAVAKARETAEKRDARAKLQKLVLDTVNWLTYPAKTDVKCPDILKKPYADFLNGIDLSSKRLANGGEATKNDLRLSNAMDSLATALDKIMTSQDPTQEVDKVLDTGYLDLPANFVSQLRDMNESIKAMMVDGDFVVNTMTAAEVRKLSQMIRTLNHAIKTMSNLYANLRFANVEELGFDTMEFMDALGEIEKTGGMKDFVQWDNALPYYAFKRFGKGGESVFEGLMDAQDKLAFLAQEIFNFRDKAWTGEEAKAWSEDTHTIKLPNGNELTLTTADAMSIYCLSRREQGLQHLLGGGTRVMGIQEGSKKAKDSRSLLTIEDISAINSSLTDRQRQVAEDIQEFMSTVCSEWGNEISMKRFLTKEFTEKYYFPIESNDENLPVKDPAAQQSDLFRLLNISATKPITPGANNEVIIRNIFDVFTGHASDMARLNAYGMGLLDYMKWLNYREKTVTDEGQVKVRGVRKSMQLAYGDASMRYVLNLIKDVNGRASDGGDPNILMKWMRAAKTASVGSSLRVATLQVTSYPRAALVLSPKSLALGLSKKPNIEMAKKYCGIALWKSFGFYDTNISRSIEDQIKGVTNVKQKLIELSLKGAEWGDAITWGALWNACEYEVAQTTKNKVGSEEFYQEVGKKLRDVVYRTQVVDSTLTRSQIMRSKRGMAQEAAAFMSEPTLSANILMDAGFEFNAEKRRTGSTKEAWKKTSSYIGKAVAVYAIGQLTAALLEGLWDAWRDEDDEKFIKKYMDAFLENLLLDLAPFNKIPIVSDVFEGALAMVGIGFYSSDKMSSTWLTQAVSAVDTWKDALSGNSSVTVYNALYKTTRAISSFFGVSGSGVLREAVALWNNTAGAYDPTLKILTYDRSKGELGGLLLDAYIEGNDRLVESYMAEFDDEDDYRSALRTAIKSRYEAGEIDYDTAEQYLVEFAGMKDGDAYWKVEEWEYETETGEDFQKYNDFYTAVQTGKDLKAVIKRYTDNGVEAKTLASQITSHFKPLYKEMSNTQRASIKGYLLNAYALLGYDRTKKSKDIDKWLED